MKCALVLLVISLLSPAVGARQTTTAANNFPAFWKEFKAAVRANDKDKILSMSDLTRFRWEAGFGDIRTKEQFLKIYPRMFTKIVKAKIAAGKPYSSNEGNYFVDWYRGNNEYTLAFDHVEGGGFKFTGLYVGPR